MASFYATRGKETKRFSQIAELRKLAFLSRCTLSTSVSYFRFQGTTHLLSICF